MQYHRLVAKKASMIDWYQLLSSKKTKNTLSVLYYYMNKSRDFLMKEGNTSPAHSALQNNPFFQFFNSYSVDHLCSPWILISIGNPDPDPVDQGQCGSIWIRIHNAAHMYTAWYLYLPSMRGGGGETAGFVFCKSAEVLSYTNERKISGYEYPVTF
jgi:hypothetical protein